jgi:hypothetical protein
VTMRGSLHDGMARDVIDIAPCRREAAVAAI